ncbi:hypothetical protein GCM10010129_39020 [Streptomyces fumigatiscleroticus]|nr:hypothetical protein GCM10010129_39020 [Streptomyces fumigatiscleroticus]
MNSETAGVPVRETRRSPAPAAPSRPARRVLRMSTREPAVDQGNDGVRYTGYEPDIALLLSAVSAWAYSDLDTLHNMLRTAFGMEDVRGEAFSVVNVALFVDTQAFFLRGTLPGRTPGDARRRIGILAFRGTEFGGVTLTDIYTDINTETVPYPDTVGASVHAGFLRAFKYAWPDIVDELAKPAHAVDHLFITGHSMGGALATLATCELVDDSLSLLPRKLRAHLRSAFRGLYTFGQPMVGDQAFADHFQTLVGAMTFRHVYQQDLVPRFPPRTAGEFRHFGREFFGTRTSLWSEQELPVQQVFSATVSFTIGILAFVLRQMPAGRKLSLPVSLADHMPQNYVDCSKLRSAATTFP